MLEIFAGVGGSVCVGGGRSSRRVLFAEPRYFSTFYQLNLSKSRQSGQFYNFSMQFDIENWKYGRIAIFWNSTYASLLSFLVKVQLII